MTDTAFRVLLASDGSAASEVATQLVRSLTWPAGTELRSVTVVAGAPVVTAAALYNELPIPIAHPAGTHRSLGAYELDVRLREGTVVEEVLDEAIDWRADLLIMGGHAGPAASRLLEPLAGVLSDHAPCAVLVARTARADRVLLVEDGSQSAARAAAFLAQLPGIGLREISVLALTGEDSTAVAADRILGRAASRGTELIVIGAPLDAGDASASELTQRILVGARSSVLIVDRAQRERS